LTQNFNFSSLFASFQITKSSPGFDPEKGYRGSIMPSSWNVYYVIFLSAALALGIPGALALVSRLVSAGKVKKRLHQEVLDEVSSRNQTLLGRRINARFFLGVNAALILITLVMVIIPCIGLLHNGLNRDGILRALIAIVSIASFAALGLIYSVRKGDLSWLTCFQNELKSQAMKGRSE
jgi:NADH:ubiquinone oxidoreductase subunit 3 (subunit A)